MKKKLVTMMVCAVSVLSLLCVPVQATEAPVMTNIVQQATEENIRAFGICANEKYAFVRGVDEILIYDIQNPKDITYVNKIEAAIGGTSLFLKVNAIDLKGDYLFVGFARNSNSGSAIVNAYHVAEVPEAPAEIYRVAFSYVTNTAAPSLATSGDLMVYTEVNGMYFCEASDEDMAGYEAAEGDGKKFVKTSWTAEEAKAAKCLSIDGNYLAFAKGNTIYLADISDVSNVQLKASYIWTYQNQADEETPQTISSVILDGNYLYAASNKALASSSEKVENKVLIFDISESKENGSAPVIAAEFEMSIGAKRVSSMELCGDLLFVMDQDGKNIRLYNVKDPTNPESLGSVASASGNAYGMQQPCLVGNRLIVADQQAGFGIYELSSTEVPSITLVQNGAAVETLAAGDVQAELHFTNYTSDAFEGTLMLAAYQDNKLREVTFRDVSIAGGSYEGSVQSGAVTIPNEFNGYQVKAFLVNDLENLVPMLPNVVK